MSVAASGTTVGYRNPDQTPIWIHRCAGTQANNGLAVGNTFANTNVLYETAKVQGAARLRVRIKTASAGGTLDVFFVGPDFDLTQPLSGVAYASLTGTIYATGNGAQATVAAGTENKVDVDCYGEGYALIKFTATGTGSVTFCDWSAV